MLRYLKLVRYLRPQKSLLLAVIITMLAATAVGLLGPWPVKLLVDNVLGSQPTPGWVRDILGVLPGPDGDRGLLVYVAIATITIFMLGTVLSGLNSLASTRLSQVMTYHLAGDVFLHLQRLSLRFHSRRPTGDTLARVTGDPACVQVLVMEVLLPFSHSLVSMGAMFAVMWALDPTLTLVALGVTPFLVLSIRVFAKPLKQRNRVARDSEGRIMTLVERTLTAIPVVQAFTREDREHQRFRRYAGETVSAYQRAEVSNVLFRFCVGMCTAVGGAVIIYVGGVFVLDGRLSLGEMLVFLAYLAGLYGPLNAMTHTGSTLQYGAAQGDRVLELLESEPDVADAPDARAAQLNGHVVYEDVTVGYEDRPVLKNISFEARPGDVTAIVGPTGAGKTTLVNMLVRFMDPWSGRVSIDGHDLRELKLKSLREQISLVLQDPYIFPITVAENIAFGRPEAAHEEIRAAAAAANAHGFIQGLPDGYDTVIGERGGTLSGGEKQRLSIARAFLKDAPILVLDEPTSSLDAGTEAMLLEALDRLMVGRVTFIIAHRLSTIRDADQLLVMDKGEIVQRGTHDGLMEEGGVYADLYRQQMEIAAHGADAPDPPSDEPPSPWAPDAEPAFDHGVVTPHDGAGDLAARRRASARRFRRRPSLRRRAHRLRPNSLASVVITNHNYGHYLGEAINSALVQTHHEREVIVVDDGSTDDSIDVIRRYGNLVRPVLQDNGGQAAAFNAGFRASSGEVVMFLDADDELLPDAVEAAVTTLAEGEHVKVHWPLRIIDASGRRTGDLKGVGLPSGDFRRKVLQEGPASALPSAPTSGNAWARHFLERVMPVPTEQFKLCADSYLFMLAPALGPIASLERPHGLFRIHGENGYQQQPFEEKLRLGAAQERALFETLRRILRSTGTHVDPGDWQDTSWWQRMELAISELTSAIPQGSKFVLVDEDNWGVGPAVFGRERLPFPERGGEYWGLPRDDDAAIEELERLREQGVRYVVIGWPAFWWLDHYPHLGQHLRQNTTSITESDRLMALELHSPSRK